MANLSFKVMSDEQLQRYLLELAKADTAYAKTVLRKKITNRLVAYAGSEKYVYSMLLIDNENTVMAVVCRVQARRTKHIRIASSKPGRKGFQRGCRMQ